MNSRSVSDNLVNFSTDLATTLNQLDSKEPLLSFPFDHLYACSEGGDRTQALQLKELEISTHCVLPSQEKQLNERLASLETQNRKLKDLLIYHLDLIQQQDELMSKREKAYQALKQENESLKCKVSRATSESKSAAENAAPPIYVPATATVTTYLTDAPSTSHGSSYNTLKNIYKEQTSAPVPYLYNPSLNSPNSADIYGLDRPSDTVDLSYTTSEFRRSLLDVTPLGTQESSPTYNTSLFFDVDSAAFNQVPMPTYNEPSASATTVDKKRPKRKPKAVEPKTTKKYTVKNNSANTKIATDMGFNDSPLKTTKTEKSTIYDNDLLGINKQSKMPAKLKKVRYGYTALQERLQLIEPTPTGEDPYQIGEAEMREQSPIPKLMLQKNNHNRMKTCSESTKVTSTITSTTARPVYDTLSTVNAPKTKRGKAKTPLASEKPRPATALNVLSEKDASEEDQDVDVEKSDSDLDWNLFRDTKLKSTSVCDFTNDTKVMDITKMDFPDFFDPGPVNADSLNTTEAKVQAPSKTKKRGARTTSLAGPLEQEKTTEPKRAPAPKRGRKRANSTAIPTKKGDNAQPKNPPAKRARRAVPVKKSPAVRGMMTKRRYHTLMGDPDLSWYLGLDPDIKKEDCDPPGDAASNVEVPRWREMNYAGLHKVEGTENLDDKVFEKRHQKLEAEERRQLRWHLRRLREQKHVERLRQRQRDPWGANSNQQQSRGEHSIWPQPIRDVQYIELTDTLPVTAFGEEVPDLPDRSFVLPWVRNSRPLRRSKRSKTLH